MKPVATALSIAALVTGVAAFGLGRASLDGRTPPAGVEPRSAAVAENRPEPRAEYNSTVDFGEVLAGASFSGTVKVANAGGADLAVKKFHRSCACFEAELVTAAGRQPLNDLSVAPGESVTIELQLRSRPDQFGAGRETLFFETNDPRCVDGRIDLTYRVKGTIAAFPRAVNFGTVMPGSAAVADIDIRASDLQAVAKPVRVVGPSAAVVCAESISSSPSARDAPPGRSIQRIRVKLVPAAALGLHEARVEIGTADAGSLPLVVPVYWRVRAPVEVSPGSIALPVQSTSGPVYSARCLVRSSSGLPIRVAITEEPAGFRVTVENAGQTPSGVAILSIECVDPAVWDRPATDALHVRLAVDLGSGRTETVTIPVSRRKTLE